MANIDGRTLDHRALEHLRILAVKRVIEDGEVPSKVMKSLGLCRTTIYPWLRKFEDQGWEALVEKIAQGPEPKLTEKQRQKVKRWILGKDPRQYGFDFGLWSRRIVQSLIEEKLGVVMGLTAVGRLLASLDITPQKPLRRAYEQRALSQAEEAGQTARSEDLLLGRSGFSIRSALGTHLWIKGQNADSANVGSTPEPQCH